MEIRANKNDEIEIRTHHEELEVMEERADGDKRIIEGYAAVFGKWTQIGSEKYGWKERIQKGAFSKALIEREVLQLRDHDWGKILGRAGINLELKEDDKGLKFRLEVPNTVLGDETLELVRKKIIKGCSFGAYTKKDTWTFDKENQVNYRTIEELDLREVTLTAIPAYTQTTATARSRADELRAQEEVDLAWEKRKQEILNKYKKEGK